MSRSDMTTPEEIAQIAAGLTDAQRRALLTGREPAGSGKWPARNAMAGKGLATTFPWSITPLGLAVAQYLRSQGNG